MKQFFFYAILLFAVLDARSQKLSADKVPAPVKSAFTAAHAGIKPSWEKEENNYEASFKEKGKDMSCLIDAKGAILETETEIAEGELPQHARDYLQKTYKGMKVKEASKIVKANGEVEYEAELNKKDIIFNSKGDFLRVDAKEKPGKEDKD